MSARKRRRRKQLPSEPVASIADRLQAQREEIFKAMGILDCCKYASDSMLAPKNGRPDMASALDAAHGLLNVAAGELGELADETSVLDRTSS
jgi:hypothetical protein